MTYDERDALDQRIADLIDAIEGVDGWTEDPAVYDMWLTSLKLHRGLMRLSLEGSHDH